MAYEGFTIVLNIGSYEFKIYKIAFITDQIYYKGIFVVDRVIFINYYYNEFTKI